MYRWVMSVIVPKKVGPPLGKQAFPTKYPSDKPTQQTGGGGIEGTLKFLRCMQISSPANYPRRHAFSHLQLLTQYHPSI